MSAGNNSVGPQVGKSENRAASDVDFKVHTFGCKVNSYDSGLIQSRLGSQGFRVNEASGSSHIHVLNTCAVTAEATKEAVRQIRRIKSKNPMSLVVVTGCAAQVDTGAFENLSGADLVVANSHKGRIGELIRSHYAGTLTQKVFKSNIFRKDDLEAGGGIEAGHTRSFLKIQDGCNSFCTYCVIPFGRGKSRSLTIDQLVQRIRELEMTGSREIVLTGVHIGDYNDEGYGLEDLVEAVLKKTTVQRLRMTSLEPPEVSDRLLEMYSDSRLCPHFHMSIQSATSSVLKKMKRQYSALEVEKSLQQISKRVPGAFVGMDVIVGFPQESDQEFEETFSRLEGLPWTRAHVFPYSSRPGTKAEQMEGHVTAQEIKARSKKLRELSSLRYSETGLQQVGTIKKVLPLREKKNGLFHGLSRDYWNIQMPGTHSLSSEVDVEITGYDHSEASRMDGVLVGRVITKN